MKNSIKKNLIYNTIYQIMIMILPLITAPYISRIIGAEGLGIYSYYHSIALYFVYFAMLGISNYGNRCISKCENNSQKRNKLFSSIYLFQVIISTVVFFVYIIFTLFIVNENKIITLVMSIHVISPIFDVSWYYFGMQEFKATSIKQSIIRIVGFITIFIFVKKQEDLWIYTLIMSLSYLISSLSLWILIWKKVKICKTSFSELSQHFKPCIILFIPIIATSIYRVMDKIMIGKFSKIIEVGYYENAEKLIMVSLGLLGSFATVIMPKISNLLSKNKIDEANKIFNKSMEAAIFIGMAICFGISSVSKEFIPIFFGEKFLPSIKLSIFLCISVPLVAWSTMIRNLYLIPKEKDSIYVKSVVLGATGNLIFNIILIPKFGALGAVFGTIIAESILTIFQTCKIRKEIDLKQFVKKTLIYGVFGTIMFIFVRISSNFFNNTILGLIFEITIGAIIYLLLSITYIIKSKEDSIFKLLKKNK